MKKQIMKFPHYLNRYEYDFKERFLGKEVLIVTFSPGRGFAYYKQDFQYDTLFIRSTGESYYTMQAGRLAENIKYVFMQGGYKKILFMGTSKGGFASLLYGALVAEKNPEARVVSIAFSPQTRLYPYNEKLTFPSYMKLYQTVQTGKISSIGLSCLKKYGDVSTMLNHKNLFCDVYYPELIERDKDEAVRLIGKNIRKPPIPISIHSVGLLCFYERNKRRTGVMKLCDKLYSQKESDLDLMHTLPADRNEFMNDVMSIKFIRPIGEIIEEDLSF